MIKSMQSAWQATSHSSTPVINGRHGGKKISVASSQPQIAEEKGQNTKISSISAQPQSHHASSQRVRLITHLIGQKVGDTRNRNQAVKRQVTKRIAKLESDRGSVIELAKFLRTKSPPPDNFMSQTEPSEPALHGVKSMFKMFRRQSSKRASDTVPKPLKLPDSAVAAKTIHGHWHIAISIPAEHDHREPNPAPQQTESQSSTVSRQEHITVMKPLIQNSRPKPLYKAKGDPYDYDNAGRLLAGRRSEAVSHTLNTENTSTMKNHNRQESLQEIEKPATLNKVSVSESKQRPKTSGSVSASSISQQNQQSDVQRLRGIGLRTRSFEFNSGYPRLGSSSSTAPHASHFIPPNCFESPGSQYSNSSGNPGGLGSSALIDSPSSSINTSLAEASFQPSVLSKRSMSNCAGSDVSSANVKIARSPGPSDLAGSQVMFTRKPPRIQGSESNKRLPALPETGDDELANRIRSNCAAAFKAGQMSPDQEGSSESLPSLNPMAARPYEVTAHADLNIRQSRRERVKALRSRDIEALKATSKCQQAVAEISAKENRDVPASSPIAKSPTAPSLHQVKRRGPSYSSSEKEPFCQRTANSLTQIMLVADLEPYSGHDSNDLVLSAPPRQLRKSKSSNTNRSALDRTYSLPQSLMPSLASSDEEVTHTPFRRTTANNRRRTIHLDISNHNQASSLRHTKSLTEDTMEARLRKIEKSNSLLLRTLNAVVEMGVGFRELQKLLPAKSTGSIDEDLQRELAGQVGKGLDNIGPLMQELQSAAMISQEDLTDGKRDQDDEGLIGGLEV